MPSAQPQGEVCVSLWIPLSPSPSSAADMLPLHLQTSRRTQACLEPQRSIVRETHHSHHKTNSASPAPSVTPIITSWILNNIQDHQTSASRKTEHNTRYCWPARPLALCSSKTDKALGLTCNTQSNTCRHENTFKQWCSAEGSSYLLFIYVIFSPDVH